jgi:hypothetical protein
MNCKNVRRSLSPYIDGQLRDGERLGVSQHIQACADCSRHHRELTAIRQAARRVHTRAVPPALTVGLRVAASKAGGRRRSPTTIWDRIRMALDQMMRPFAIPAAGGLVSALMLFSLLVPPFYENAEMGDFDVPTILYTEASVKSYGPLSYTDEDIFVELSIDDQGRISDYTLPASLTGNPELRRVIERNLVMVTFQPATAFGQPLSGKLRVSFRKSNPIEVKG